MLRIKPSGLLQVTPKQNNSEPEENLTKVVSATPYREHRTHQTMIQRVRYP